MTVRCDYCDTPKTDPIIVTLEADPILWLHIEATASREYGPFDFCRESCLVGYYSDRARPHTTQRLGRPPSPRVMPEERTAYGYQRLPPTFPWGGEIP